MAFLTKEYTFSDVKARLLSGEIVGMQSFSFSKTQPKKNVYGTKKEPISRVRGKKEYEGSIGMTYGQKKKLEDSVPSGDILDIKPFLLTISYSDEDDRLRTKRVKYVEFTGDSEEGDNGNDDELAGEFDIIFAGIENVV